MIDVGDSYKKFCETVGGQYFTVDDLKMCPFTYVTDIKASAEQIRDLLSVMAYPNESLGDVQRAYLEKAIIQAYAIAGQQATIDTVVDCLVKADEADPDPLLRRKDLAVVLEEYTSRGTKGRFFNASSNLAPEANFCVLDLKALEKQPDLMKVVLFSMILYISQQMYQSPRSLRKVCVIDEAWQLFNTKHQAAADFIEKGFRTARRHTGAFIAISQALKDFHSGSAASAAWNNSDFKLIMKQNDQAFDEFVSENPSLYTPYEQRLIKGFDEAKANGYSEFLLQRGSVNTFHRLFTDPFSRIMYSSAGDEFEAVEQYRRQGLPIEDAIRRVATERYPKEMNV